MAGVNDEGNEADAKRAKKYDVALSFLGRDLALAQEIRDGLAPQLSVFVYSHSQDEVAGTEGLESFPEVFREESRLVVILHRAGWGESPWTRVEAQAMKDRLLQEGADFLFVATLDSTAVPKWIPSTRIRYSLEDFGISQLIGAIKLRASELGSRFHRETVGERAKRAQEQQEFEASRTEQMSGFQGVEAATRLATQTFEALSVHAEEIQDNAPKLGVEYGYDPENRLAVMRVGIASLSVSWRAHVLNALSEAQLLVQRYNSKVILPNEKGLGYLRQPNVVEKMIFLPELTRALGWCWKDPAGKLLTPARLAERITGIFFLHLDDINSGKLKPPKW